MKHFIDGWVEMEATQMGESTTKGVLERDFPIKSGNSFTVYVNPQAYPMQQGFFCGVLNFNAENLDELLRLENPIEWPIKVRVEWARKLAVINDPRIPDEWYGGMDFAPVDLIDTHTRLDQLRRIDRGDRTESEGMVTEKVKAERRALDTRWSVETAPPVGGFTSPLASEIHIPKTGDVLGELGKVD